MNAIVKTAPPAALVPVTPPSLPDHSGAALYRISTDAAALCREIVLATSSNIQGRKYVAVEGWQSIALAHGCAASSGDVIRLEDGSVSAVGRVIRIDTGTVISSAEGYVGADEATWFGGPVTDKWGKTKILPKRADYAIRAMAQTRAISRACRSAFAHVVVMMNVGLSTTPAEEVPDEGFERQPATRRLEHAPESTPAAPAPPQAAAPKRRTAREWLDNLALSLSAAQTEADVDAITGSDEVRKVIALWGPENDNGDPEKNRRNAANLADLNALMAEAIARVSTPHDPETGEVDEGFPGDKPLL